VNLDERLATYLWEHADRLGRIRVHQGDLAQELGYEAKYLAKVMKDLERAGRIKKIRTAIGNVGTYAVKDPSSGERFRQ
jgi:DNA-binding MarR family transcriptional regulator